MFAKFVTEDSLRAALLQVKADADADPKLLAELNAAPDEAAEVAVVARQIFERLE